MVTVTEPRPMAKKKMGRPTSGRDDASVKIDRGLALKAKLIATNHKITVAELLSSMLRPSIEREYAKLVKEVDAGGGK